MFWTYYRQVRKHFDGILKALGRDGLTLEVKSVVAEPEMLLAPEPIIADAPKEDTRGTGDADLKLKSARCDVHPLYPLRATRIEFEVPGAPADSHRKALCCMRQSCNRHYLTASGYFSVSPGEPPDLGRRDSKPHCNCHDHPRYMVVTKLPAGFLWSCPEPGCTKVSAYDEAGGVPDHMSYPHCVGETALPQIG